MSEFIIRLLIMAVPICAGGALGWLLSPKGRFIRPIMFLGGAGIAVLIGLFFADPIGALTVISVGVVGFFVALGWMWRSHGSGGATKPTTFGSSRWANQSDVTEHKLNGNTGIRLGKFFNDGRGSDISYKGDRHLLTVAPTRSGKGTTQIIPNLLTYEGSMLVIDPKGENALISAKRRQDMGQDVHIVDPWGIADVEGVSSSQFNPLDWLDLRDVDITENAMLLADALVVEGNNDKSFFIEEAKALLQGLIMYVATADEEDGLRSLKRVRDILVLNSDEQTAIFQNMANSGQHIIKSTGNRCLQKDKELLANVMASTQAQTHFLDSARIQKNTLRSDFKFEDMKSKPMTIYLVLPSDRLNAFGRWMRLLIQQAITVNARNIEEKPKKPILFILDEFAAIGRLSMIEQAYGLMAGFGMQLWAIVQDFNQLERIYDKGWQSFVANAGMINYFGSTDKMTAEYFSSLCGETTVWNFSTSLANAFGSSQGQGGPSSNSSETSTDTRAAGQRKLAYPDELMRMHDQKQLVFIENMHPMLAVKERWFDNAELKPLGVDLYADK